MESDIYSPTSRLNPLATTVATTTSTPCFPQSYQSGQLSETDGRTCLCPLAPSSWPSHSRLSLSCFCLEQIWGPKFVVRCRRTRISRPLCLCQLLCFWQPRKHRGKNDSSNSGLTAFSLLEFCRQQISETRIRSIYQNNIVHGMKSMGWEFW